MTPPLRKTGHLSIEWELSGSRTAAPVACRWPIWVQFVMAKKIKKAQPKNAQPKKPSLKTVAWTRERALACLKPFLDHNTESLIDERKVPDGKTITVRKPWGDDSLVIDLPSGAVELIDALNNVILPERFNAIYHRDTKSLEFLWTPYPLTGQRAVCRCSLRFRRRSA